MKVAFELQYIVFLKLCFREERIKAYFDNNFLPNIKLEPINNSNKVIFHEIYVHIN